MFDPYTLNMLLKDYGKDIILRRVTDGVYNTVTGTVSRTNTDIPVRAYFYNDVPQTVEESPLTRGTKRVVLKGTTIAGGVTPEPSVQDLIVSTGDAQSISKVSPINSNTSVVCYILHVKE